MPERLKILTFNWHEPYICHLAKLGHEFYVAAPELGADKFREWDRNMRDLPANCFLVTLAEARHALSGGDYDLAIAHNIKDLIVLSEFNLPKINVFHCRLTTEIALSPGSVDRGDYLQKISPFLDGVTGVFISESKKSDWGLAGEVIVHGIDPSDYGGYTGRQEAVLRVGNLLREMDLARGFTLSERVLAGFPHATLGLNPTIPGSRLSRGFQDLLHHYRECRLYLNTTPEEYEDGYNLSMLEAMATGMPVVSLGNASSPIVHGVNGYVSDDPEVLRKYVRELLADPERARILGERARNTVREKFGIRSFLDRWRQVIEQTLRNYLVEQGFHTAPGAAAFRERKRKNILMDFVSHPATTAYYLKRALQDDHNLLTCGAMLTHEVIRQWKLEELHWPIEPQDIFRGDGTPVMEIWKQLPEGWQPDFYFYVETGLNSPPPDLEAIPVPRVCYLIDTHIHLERHLEMARHFDFVFIAQKEYLGRFHEAGHTRTFWLPLGCDPEIHGQQSVDKIYDVGFVGSLTAAHGRRKGLLEQLGRYFNVKVDRKFMDEMTRVFCQSRIVFNHSIRNDLNMRVFEALCSGSLLMTDPAPGSGLEELFEPGRHLVLYAEDRLVETARHYLKHGEERERIARAGCAEVLARHTYRHRMMEMVRILEKNFQDIHRSSLHVTNGKESPVEYFQHVREDILKLVPADSRAVLEIGCGEGRTGAALKKNPGVFVAGVECHPQAAREARKHLDDVQEGDIETLALPYPPASFDCILFGDVLEHLVHPEEVLKKLLPLLKAQGSIVASIPNVQYYALIHHLVEGNWTYQDEGILDRTHLRFFTYREIVRMFEGAGLEITQVDETLSPEYERFRNEAPDTLALGRMTLTGLSPEELRRFFVFQYKVVARRAVAAPTAFQETGGEPAEWIKKAEALEQGEHYQDALESYLEFSRRYPARIEGWVGQGRCLMRFNRRAEAERCYRRALDLDSKHVKARLGMGTLSMQNGKLDAARDHYLKALEQDPENSKALCGCGLVAYQKGQVQEARERLVRSLRNDLDNSPAMTCLLQLSYDEGRFEDVTGFMSEYLKLHPANLKILFALAGVYYKQNQLLKSRECLDRILLFEPDNEDAQALMQALTRQPVTS